MSAFYLQLRTLHIACVVVSVLLFIVRHLLNLRGINWRKSLALRIMPHVVDSVLLISALLLCVAIGQYPFINAWLTVKVIALVAYIVLAMQALKPSLSQSSRRVAFMLAIITFGFIVTVARTQSPLGIFGQF